MFRRIYMPRNAGWLRLQSVSCPLPRAPVRCACVVGGALREATGRRGARAHVADHRDSRASGPKTVVGDRNSLASAHLLGTTLRSVQR
jgi:hypothetical protein